MKRQLAMVGGLLIACNVSYASDCSPGSPMYEDTFFKYCDDARAAYQAAATLTKEEPAPDAEAPGTDSAAKAAPVQSTVLPAASYTKGRYSD